MASSGAMGEAWEGGYWWIKSGCDPEFLGEGRKRLSFTSDFGYLCAIRESLDSHMMGQSCLGSAQL